MYALEETIGALFAFQLQQQSKLTMTHPRASLLFELQHKLLSFKLRHKRFIMLVDVHQLAFFISFTQCVIYFMTKAFTE